MQPWRHCGQSLGHRMIELHIRCAHTIVSELVLAQDTAELGLSDEGVFDIDGDSTGAQTCCRDCVCGCYRVIWETKKNVVTASCSICVPAVRDKHVYVRARASAHACARMCVCVHARTRACTHTHARRCAMHAQCSCTDCAACARAVCARACCACCVHLLSYLVL